MGFEDTWIRIHEKLGVKNFVHLAVIVGQTTSNITKKKNKDEFPVDWAYKVAVKFGVLTEWVLTGKSPMSLDDEFVPSSDKELMRDDEIRDEDEFVECYFHKEFIKRVPIVKGGLYEIDPVNPASKKMKGERVILIDAEFVGPTTCLRIDSEWHLKRRNYTTVDPCNLRIISRNPNLTELGFDANTIDMM